MNRFVRDADDEPYGIPIFRSFERPELFRDPDDF